MSVTSDRPGFDAFNQAHTRWLAANVEAVRWDSDAARETVARICQEAARRCQQVIAVHNSVDILDEGRHNHLDPKQQESAVSDTHP